MLSSRGGLGFCRGVWLDASSPALTFGAFARLSWLRAQSGAGVLCRTLANVSERVEPGGYTKHALHAPDVSDKTDDFSGASGKIIQLRGASSLFQYEMGEVWQRDTHPAADVDRLAELRAHR